MPAELSTRILKSAAGKAAVDASPSLLVRIYPVNAIDRPVELGREPLLIGREPHCSLALEDDAVSRRHALIEAIDGGHAIIDLASLNGTYVNDQRLCAPHRLEAGDRIRIGNHIYKYLTADRMEAQYHEVMFAMMTMDGLTSVYNKRYLLETLDRELAQSHRTGSPLCLMMLDLDRFKSINDNYGHLVGDAVLVEFARRAKAVLRSGELLARYGGEEFAIVLTQTALADAVVVAERVRESTALDPVVYESLVVPMTVSIGVCEYAGRAPCEPNDLLVEADALLYAAKQQGRNRVLSASRN